MKPTEVYVDIDGTLTFETEGYGEGVYANRSPRLDVIKFVNLLYAKGYIITLWSARHEEDREITMGWLSLYAVKYHKLVLDKPKYDILIDDKVICPGNFLKLMGHLN